MESPAAEAYPLPVMRRCITAAMAPSPVTLVAVPKDVDRDMQGDDEAELRLVEAEHRADDADGGHDRAAGHAGAATIVIPSMKTV